MSEFYHQCQNEYQKNAQPYLDAIASGIKNLPNARKFIFKNTEFENSYSSSIPLWSEQSKTRNPANTPFWANYFSEVCPKCDCRMPDSKAMEIDALFFLENEMGSKIAVHVEIKMNGEPFKIGQAEAYKPRARCYKEGRRVRNGVMPHNDFMTVVFCGQDKKNLNLTQYFDRIIFHDDARMIFENYPYQR